MRIDSLQMGKLAVEMLFRLIDGEELSEWYIEMPTELIDRRKLVSEIIENNVL